MKKKQPTERPVDALKRGLRDLDTRRIDQLYGLEPVYEPGTAQPGVRAEEFVPHPCPWCGERLETRVDVSAGEHSFVEDCQVCCRPMEMTVEVEENGALRGLRVQRVE